MKLLFLLNKKIDIYICKKFYGLNLYKINLLYMVINLSIFKHLNINKYKLSLYRLNIYIYKICRLKSNNILKNKIKKFNKYK